MGMAASQARYLGLTARKTNLEYEGQQINQARTALGNQSATLWNQMLSLSIPTVPNTTDFTTLQYAFSDGYNNYTITNYESCDHTDPTTGVKYNTQVTYCYNQDTFKGVEAINTNPQVQHVDPNTVHKFSKADNNCYIFPNKTGLDETALSTSTSLVAKTSGTLQYLIANEMESLPAGATLKRYSYTDDSVSPSVTKYLYGTSPTELQAISYVSGSATATPTQSVCVYSTVYDLQNGFRVYERESTIYDSGSQEAANLR